MSKKGEGAPLSGLRRSPPRHTKGSPIKKDHPPAIHHREESQAAIKLLVVTRFYFLEANVNRAGMGNNASDTQSQNDDEPQNVRPSKRQNGDGPQNVRPNKRNKIAPNAPKREEEKPYSHMYTVDDSHLNPSLTSQNTRASKFGGVPQIRPAHRSLDDCQMSTLKAKALEACKQATKEVEGKLEKMDEIDRHLDELARRKVYKIWSSNPREARELLLKEHPEINTAIDTLRSEVEDAVTPFRNTLHEIRSEALQCYKKQCASRDPSELGTHITKECKNIVNTIGSIQKQLDEKCTVFNLRANAVAKYFQDTYKMDEEASKKANFSALGLKRFPQTVIDTLTR